jgi:Flp pilus assembly protein TadD
MASGYHPPNMTASSRLLILLVIVVAVVPYLPSLHFGFVYDDHLAIEENPHLNLWPGLSRIFFSDVWSLSSLGKGSNYYRRMFLLTYEGIFHAAGPVPWAFHFVNLALHGATAVVVFLLSLRVWKKNSIAVMATILFALHPTHAEPVGWIAALSELGYTFFIVLALYFYVQEEPTLWSAASALLSYAMALLWKESALAFVPIIVLFDVLVLRQPRWKLWASAAGVTLAYLGVRIVALHGMAPDVVYPGLTLWTQVLTPVSNIGFYIGKLVVPIQLSAIYTPEFVSRVNARVAVVVLLAILGVWKLRGRMAWSALWIVAGLSPVLLVSRVAVPLADRDLYLPSIGFVWLIAVLLDSWPARIAVPLFAVSGIASSVLLHEYLSKWRDDIPLFEHVLLQQPDSKPARLMLASELARRGQFEKAVAYLDEILLRQPDDAEALIDKAGVQLSMKDFSGVKATCAKVFAIDPNSARCWYNIGYLDENEGRFAEAREKFVRAFQRDPELSQALLHRGVMEARTGDLNQATETLEMAVQRIPTAPALNNLGTVYAERGEFQKAVKAFEMAVRVDPAFELARRNLERAIADSR